MGGSVSTVEAIQYCGGIAAVLRGIASVHVGDSISTCGGDSISTAEAIQYCLGIASVLWGDSISTVEK